MQNFYDPWVFPHCPGAPDWELDWDGLCGRFAWLRELQGIVQDPVFHAEGDVLTHTRLVCEALMQMAEWRQMTEPVRNMLLAAALLHDVAKPFCTRVDHGRITSGGHALLGEFLTREILYKETGLTTPVPFACREEIAKLVRFHGLPLFFLEKEDPVRAVLEASQMVRLDWLALLAKADVLGRRCPDRQELLERIELFADFCREHGCYRERGRFADAYSRFLYFQKEKADPAYRAYDDTKFEVILMSGLPAAGKDTWVARHCAGLPVVSLDRLRQELKIAPDEEQGQVVQAAKERARQFLRDQRPFVWNATNISRATRRQLIALFTAYGARVKIVYLEVPYALLLRRNRERSAPVPEKAIHRMIHKLEVPVLTEAPSVQWIVPSTL
ncbi:AAA family ATPase [Acetonema longum]|uniref:PolyA polymerase related protein n=1 Tax=Acetonema longum DSM 6540 TaxID=1009370 RepID=F7NGU6_9FIRM|nr:AAA family ATPase [Acetonema longum]EGO64677.1 polyA polymerase related protein [Acetonema longum DSM 6540]